MLGLLRFLSLLTYLLVRATFNYFFKRLTYRKGAESLRNALKMTVCKTGLQLSVKSAKHIHLYSNGTLVRRIMKLLHRGLVKLLPGYGQQFDEHSIWLVKHNNINSSSQVMIYMHGGGYYIQTAHEQLAVVLSIYKLTSPEVQNNLDILLLDYKLACEGFPVPTQLHQLFATYMKLISVGYTNICFFGDSAGGNLSISFSQLLYHYYNRIPHPIVDPLPPFEDKQAQIYPGAQIYISPWVKIKPSVEQGTTPGCSWHDNENYDIIQYSNPFEYHDIVSSSLSLSDIMVSPGNHGYKELNEWHRIPTYRKGNSVLVIYGEDESFRDDITDWCTYALNVPQGALKPGTTDNEGVYSFTRTNSNDGADVYIYMEPKGIHDSVFFLEDGIIGKVKSKKDLKYDTLDTNKYHAVTRIVRFLDTVMVPKQ